MDPTTERLDAHPASAALSGNIVVQSSSSNWWVFGAGIAVALGLWTLWLVVGIGCVHKQFDKAAGKFAAQGASAAAPAVPPVSPTQPSAPDGKTTEERKAAYFTQVGQMGDAFGGLNAALTALAGALVFWAGFMQHQTLRHARAETARLQRSVQEERSARQKQEFESLFFRMLSLTREVTERIEVPRRIQVVSAGAPTQPSPTRRGAAALDSFADRVISGWAPPKTPKEQLESLTDLFMKRVYNTAPSAMGPYFRMLYQTFKLIDQSGLSYKERVPYANIARGQISEGAVLLLGLNGWARYGYKFVPYIEKYGLLEHMHPKYLQLVKPALRYGYRERAFLGSEQRDLPGNEWKPRPHLDQFYPEGMDESARTEDLEQQPEELD